MSTLDNFANAASWCYQVIARPVLARGSQATRTAFAAAFRTAGKILTAVGSGIGETLRQVGDSEARKLVAKNDADVERAKAGANAKRLAQVEKAKVDKQRYEAQLTKAETDLKQAEASKTEAEAERLRAEADAIRTQEADRQRLARIEAWERIETAISRIKQAGGSVVFDEENLRQIITGRRPELSNNIEKSESE